MDDDVGLLPVGPSELTAPTVEAPAPAGGSGWWPVIAVVATVVALFALIRDEGEPRHRDEPADQEAPVPTAAVSTAPTESVAPALETSGPEFDPPLFGRVWNSELVLVDADVVRFVDLATGDVRSADVSEEIRPPVAFFRDSIAFSNGRDLIRVTPGFANPRFVRADAREVTPLPGLPVAFHDHDSTDQVEIVVVGENMGSTVWLDADARPWAMWNGEVLTSIGERIEAVSLDGSETRVLAEGTVLAASGDAVLYRSCGTDGADGEDAPAPAEPDCQILLMRRDGAVTPSVQLPEDVLAVSLGPHGNSLIFVAPLGPASDIAVVFVSGTDESANGLSVTSFDIAAAVAWPSPMWSHDGSAAVVAGRDGPELIDLEGGGSLSIDQVVGGLEGDIVGFVSIRHEAGTTSLGDSQ